MDTDYFSIVSPTMKLFDPENSVINVLSNIFSSIEFFT